MMKYINEYISLIKDYFFRFKPDSCDFCWCTEDKWLSDGSKYLPDESPPETVIQEYPYPASSNCEQCTDPDL